MPRPRNREQRSHTPRQYAAMDSAAVVTLSLVILGEPRRTRTFNQLIKSQLLCQLS